MKKIIPILISVPALLLAGCARDGGTTTGPADDTVEITYRSQAPEATRVSLDGVSVRWQDGDAVNILDKSRASRAAVSSITSGGRSATVTATVTAGEQVYAFSPYSDAVTLSKSTIKATIPAEQDGTFSGAHLAAARADGSTLTFSSVVALFSFSADGYPSARYVRIEPINSGEYAAGEITVKYNPDMSVSLDSGKSSAVLVPVSGGTAYAGIFPGYFKRGFNFQVLDASQTVLKTIPCEKVLSLSPGEHYDFGELSNHEPSDPPTPTEPFMQENFSKCNGKGGNDGDMAETGNLITSPDTKTDCAGWDLYNCSEGSGCIIVGSIESGGYAMTPPLEAGEADGNYTLTFRMACLLYDTGCVGYLEVVGSGAISSTEVEVEKGSWVNIKVYLTDVSEGTRIKFKNNQEVERCRLYLDSIKLTEGCPEFQYLNIYQTRWTIEADQTSLDIPCRTNCYDIMVGFYQPSYAWQGTGCVHFTAPANTSTKNKEWSVLVKSDDCHMQYMLDIIQKGAQ